jgi:hypothetical protein
VIHVITFKWHSPSYSVKYAPETVDILADMVRRRYHGPLRFVCVTDDPGGVEAETFPLWTDCADLVNASGQRLPSCYRRLKLFDPATQKEMGIARGERIVSIDLDTVIVGGLNALWDRDEPFIGWAVKGSYHPRVFNGSMWMLRAGEEAHVWRTFDPDKSPELARRKGYLGSDQSWMSLKLQGRAGWTDDDGVVSYPLTLSRTELLPPDARVVMFHGFKKPWARTLPQWVRNHYRRSARGRCLVLGYGQTVWEEAEQALVAGRPFDFVMASPEVAIQWPGTVDATVFTDEQADAMVAMHDFDEVVFCGRSEVREAA